MTFLKRQNYGESGEKKKKQWFPGTRGQERMKRQSTENVEGREIILYDTIIVDTLSKLIEGTTKSKL